VLPTGVSAGWYTVDGNDDPDVNLAVKELPCPAGFYCAGGARTECATLGEYCPEQSKAPVACPAGSYCPTSAEKRDCVAGEYCAESANPRPCAAGHYCVTPASETACPQNTHCPVRSTLPSPCLSCAIGEGLLLPCSTEGDDTICETCDANSVSVGGGDHCTPCPTNERPNGSKSACVPCLSCGLGEGFVSECVDGEDTICEACGVDSISVGGMESCTPCPENERPNGSKSACLPCKFCGVGEGVTTTCQMDGSEFQDTICQVCPAGEFSPGGYSACLPCKPTQYCPAGTPAPRLCSKGRP
jgi:hypothetical protein